MKAHNDHPIARALLEGQLKILEDTARKRLAEAWGVTDETALRLDFNEEFLLENERLARHSILLSLSNQVTEIGLRYTQICAASDNELDV